MEEVEKLSSKEEIKKQIEKCYGCMGATFLDCEKCDKRKDDQKDE